MQKQFFFFSSFLLSCLLFFSIIILNKSQLAISFLSNNNIQYEFSQINEELHIFSKNNYLNKTHQRSKDVIVFLVASFTGDIRLAYNPYPKLRDRLAQLDERFIDGYTTDVIIFHTGYPFREDLLPLLGRTRRQIEFINVDHIFYKFPPGFKPHIRDPNWSQKGKWNYHHMCNFWFKQVFTLKILQSYRYMMRLDDDSQILGQWPNLFKLMARKHAVYFANKREVDYEYVLPGLSLVLNLTAAYIKTRNLTIQNPTMFIDLFNSTKEIPNFWNNFEIVDLAFMQRSDVQDFIEEINQSKGIFLYRWGDATLRYIMMTLFTKKIQILNREMIGLLYCHPC